MEKRVGRILQDSDVRLEGCLHLEVPATEQNKPNDDNAASVTPQACMVENQPQFAVVEVTCSCGKKTYLRCEYAPSGAASEAAERKAESDKT